MKVEVLESREIHRGFFRLNKTRLHYERFAGGMSREVELETVERGDGVAVLPYDPRRDRVMLIRQFRLPLHLRGEDGWSVEIPAGSLHEGVDPMEEARRELREETGLIPYHLAPMHTYYLSPSGSTERLFLFLGLTHIPDAPTATFGLEEEGEEIATLPLSFEKALLMLEAEPPRSATLILALQWLALNRERLRQEFG